MCVYDKNSNSQHTLLFIKIKNFLIYVKLKTKYSRKLKIKWRNPINN